MAESALTGGLDQGWLCGSQRLSSPLIQDRGWTACSFVVGIYCSPIFLTNVRSNYYIVHRYWTCAWLQCIRCLRGWPIMGYWQTWCSTWLLICFVHNIHASDKFAYVLFTHTLTFLPDSFLCHWAIEDM